MKQEIVALYDEYTHAPLPRRVFLKRLAVLAGGTAAAYTLLPLLENNYTQAAMVADDDARIATQTVSIGDLNGYLALPAELEVPVGAVLVIHENRGLNPYIEDVTRRLALAGFVALAPDFLSPLGGTPDDEDRARQLIAQLDNDLTLQNAAKGLSFLKATDKVNGKVGCVGFCWGGGLANQLAVAAGDALEAAVVFYGQVPPAEQVTAIQAPLLLHYAGLDQRINAGIEGYQAALDAAGKAYQIYVYEGVNHAFHNDTNAARYDPQAAELAWQRTLAFFQEHLG